MLDQLAPLSAKKLARHLVGLSGGRTVDEARVAEALRVEPLWMELQARTLNEISAGAGIPKKRMLPALGALVEGGVIVRGRALRCPVCNYPDWLALRDLDERVTCRACGSERHLPASDPGGTREADMHYRLDGLVARCMDQDLLPVLLALRSLQRLEPHIEVKQVWPGILFRRGPDEQDVDLLISTGSQVTVFECKARAETLRVGGARSLVQIARELDAVPAVAALHGEFATPVRSAVTSAGGVVLQRRHLLAPAPSTAT